MTRTRRAKARRGCLVCGSESLPRIDHRCPECHDVFLLVSVFEPETLALVVDGGYVPRRGHRWGFGGAGLVLSSLGETIATKSIGFSARGSYDAEHEALVRGLRWAPGVDVYADNESAIKTLSNSLRPNRILEAFRLVDSPPKITWLPRIARLNEHQAAHDLAQAGRRDYERKMRRR